MDDVSGQMATAVLDREATVRALLAELDRRRLTGDAAAVRADVRGLARTDRELFLALTLTLSGSQQFFGDVEATLDVSAADRLRDLEASFGALSDSFAVVRSEVLDGRHNPVTAIDTTITYDADAERPIVEYGLTSGSVERFRARESPAELLTVVEGLLGATTDALEATGDRTLSTEELGGLIDRREAIESELDRLRDRIDALRQQPPGDQN
ncbi:hypothetical protein [Halococcoides cellulosivorans]|uniref:Uncharacterized protein n=1 Tax=Halococcoides cellulosivorans TaxID=1679096 RepID=A0A2R4WYE6_9EURY|nr:hypothetical protein [Halococcoides cellulosivorans]AWB26550.1 hypothetical protein HARCEL1_01895 [Halococcoides cellulosivorans]